jgi:hypothetical protein
MSSKQVIEKLYRQYKEAYLNELYDSPLPYKKEDSTRYTVYSQDGKDVAYFLFTFMYNINDSPVDYKKYKLDKYWDVSWYWSQNLPKEEKNKSNFIKVTSTSFKIVDDFIRNNNYPALIGFGGLSKKHENLYSNKLFIDRWEILFSERYYVEWKNDKMWIINKNFYKIDELRLVKHSIYEERSISEVYKATKFPNKKDLKGISKHDLIKEQIKRVILKKIYIK